MKAIQQVLIRSAILIMSVLLGGCHRAKVAPPIGADAHATVASTRPKSEAQVMVLQENKNTVLEISNASNSPLYFSTGLPILLNFPARMFDATGRECERTELGRKLSQMPEAGSLRLNQIQPGCSVRFDYPIDQWFVMPKDSRCTAVVRVTLSRKDDSEFEVRSPPTPVNQSK